MTKKEKLINKILEYQKTKDMKLREEIILDNLDYADKLIRNYSEKYSVNFDDLRSYGYEGLILGIDSYTEDSKLDIIQHIFYIIGKKLLYGTAEVKGFTTGELRNYFEAKKEVEEEYGMPLEDIKVDKDDLADRIINETKAKYNDNIKKEEVTFKIYKDFLGDLSLDDKKTRYKLNKENYLMDLTNYESIPILKEIRRNLIASSRMGMNEFEQAILITYYGLDYGEDKTLEDIGNMFNVSYARAEQIHKKAIRKMRHPSRSSKLYKCCEFFADHDYYRR